jgi:hypothetical protein
MFLFNQQQEGFLLWYGLCSLNFDDLVILLKFIIVRFVVAGE